MFKIKKTILCSLLFSFILIGLNSCKNELSIPENNIKKTYNLVHDTDFITWIGSETLGNTFGYSTTNYFTRSGEVTYTGTYTKYQSDRKWENTPQDPIPNDEKEYVLNYIKEHPDEGYYECDLVNYYIQNVGGSYDEYELYFNENNIQKCIGSEKMNFLKINGIHINDFNAATGGGNWGLCENMPLNDPYYQESYANTEQHNKYKFYYIEYNGKMNVYLCFDYATKKYDNGQMNFEGDGVYNDWVIKLTPADGSNVIAPDDNEKEETYPPVTSPLHNNEVEINLSINDTHLNYNVEDLVSKLSIHVRKATDVQVFIPISPQYYCQTDDLYIFNTHEFFVYGENNIQTVSYNVNGNTVQLNVEFSEKGITITTNGINQNVIDYCFNTYGDGINFEIYNYFCYNEQDENGKWVRVENEEGNISKETLQEWLNKSTVTFIDEAPNYYINAFGKDNEGRDCFVKPTNEYLQKKDNMYHLNNSYLNIIYYYTTNIDDKH